MSTAELCAHCNHVAHERYCDADECECSFFAVNHVSPSPEIRRMDKQMSTLGGYSLPFSVEKVGSREFPRYEIVDAIGGEVCSGMHKHEADAIAEACNAYESLTSRVAELEGALTDLLRDEKVLDDDSPRLEATRAKARAALSKSTGGAR
jgi:hypothetical protein